MIVGVALSIKTFIQRSLVATPTTGSQMKRSELDLQKMESGPRGGDAQIAAMVTKGEIDCVKFFRDPLDKHPHEPFTTMPMRICDVHNVPLATNHAAARPFMTGSELT